MPSAATVSCNQATVPSWTTRESCDLPRLSEKRWTGSPPCSLSQTYNDQSPSNGWYDQERLYARYRPSNDAPNTWASDSLEPNLCTTTGGPPVAGSHRSSWWAPCRVY